MTQQHPPAFRPASDLYDPETGERRTVSWPVAGTVPPTYTPR